MLAAWRHVTGFELNEKWRSILSRSHRTFLALVGGYFLTNGFIALMAAGLPHLGMPTGEAAYFGLLTGLVLFIGLAVWVAATLHLVLMTASIAILAVATTLIAPMIASLGA
ncbi:MAG: hypothetical protein AAGH38_04380 [Pseudomonadota bacterium]